MKTTLKTTNYNEFADWRAKLEAANTTYEWYSEPAGDAIQYVLDVDTQAAVEVLHFNVQDIAQATKATKPAHPFVQFIVGLGLLLGFVLFIGYCFSGGSEDEPMTAQELRQYKLDGIIQKWDGGSFYPLVEYTKQYMNDPSSFEHVKTTWTDDGGSDTLRIRMTFTGANMLGGRAKHQVYAEMDIDGQILKFEQEY